MKTTLINHTFKNGEYSNGTPCLYTLVFITEKNGDDFAIYKHLDSYCVGHNNYFDFENNSCQWAWGHYDFNSIELAKKFIENF